MARHLDPNDRSLPKDEPVSIAELVRMVLVVLVALGWVSFDETVTNTIATAVGALISIVASWWARRKVIPVAKLPGGPG